MIKIKIQTQRPYEVFIGQNILSKVGAQCKWNTGAKKALIVTDTGVPKGIVEAVTQSLEGEGIEVFTYRFKRGEKSKTLKTYSGIISALADNAFNRKDAVVAVGGGVVGDMAGFAAATYMRGIDYVQVPTTLLSAIDSSVGGKTAIDLPQGKNLVGAFHQPCCVVCDVNAFSTLSVDDIRTGLGEGVKYALLDGGAIWSIIKDAYYDPARKCLVSHVNGYEEAVDWTDFVAECVKIKAKIVGQDECENGLRKLLNFGHSFGHAVEKLSNYAVPHGVAVAKGIVASLKFFESTSAEKSLRKQVEAIFSRFGIDTEFGYPAEAVVQAMQLDKKAHGDSISLVAVRGAGNPAIVNVQFKKILKKL